MSDTIQDSTASKIARGLDAVMTAAPSQRAAVFAEVHLALTNWLQLQEKAGSTDSSQADYIRRARIYLRALKTYPASSDEWLEVFWSFHKMFDRWTLGTHRQILINLQSDAEIERLRKNTRLILKDDQI